MAWFDKPVPLIVYFACAILLSSQANQVSAQFKFLNNPRMFYAIRLGSKFNLNCTTNDLSANTTLHYRQSRTKPWQQLLPKDERLVKSGEVYTVLDFSLSDSGQYQCRASNDQGNSIKWSEFLGNVIANRNLIPEVRVIPEYAVVLTAGQSYNITCLSVTHITLEWLKKNSDGTETAVPSNKVSLEKTSKQTKLILMFKNAQKSDAGTYRCLMTYQGKTNFRYSTLTVYDRFKFIKQPKMFYVVPFDANFTINCKTNEPKAIVSLYYRGNSLRPWQIATKLKNVIKSGQIFTILEFGIHNIGEYQCRGRNSRGDTIKWKKGFGRFFGHLIRIPDVTIVPRHNIVLQAGQSQNLTCSSVYGSTTLSWWFSKLDSGKYVEIPSRNVVRKRDGGQLKITLMIKKASMKDSGSYKCLLIYQGKRNQKYTSVKVLGNGLIPRIRGRKTKVLSVNERGQVVMSCLAKGHPQPNITWFKGITRIGCFKDNKSCGPELQYTLKTRIKRKNGTKYVRSQLKINTSSRKRDQGNYTCTASNKLGVARRKYQLIIT